MFADVTMDEFLDIAENWIVNRWKVPSNGSRWERETRKNRFSERNWRLSYNDHGSEPTVERFSTYLEKHAMFCAIGELINSRSLLHHDEESKRLETWVKENGLEFPPLWLADLRGPIPLETRFWYAPSDPLETWIDGVSEKDFMIELGVGSSCEDTIVVDGWHETRSSRFSSGATVASALVEPTTAAALMRALQSAVNPYDYKLPDEGEDQFEIDTPPYRLIGWLRNSSAWHTGIDQKDPLRMSIHRVNSLPGGLAEGFHEKTSAEGWPSWYDRDGCVAFQHEGWSNMPDDHSDRRLRGLHSEGRRLWMRVPQLQRLLMCVKMDLIVSIKTMREEGDRDYSEDHKKKKRSEKWKVIVLRANGDIEDFSGRIGAWQTLGTRTAT